MLLILILIDSNHNSVLNAQTLHAGYEQENTTSLLIIQYGTGCNSGDDYVGILIIMM